MTCNKDVEKKKGIGRATALLLVILLAGLVFAGLPQTVRGKTTIKAPAKVSYKVGSKGKLKASVTPKKGIALKYTSSKKKVLTISSKGKYKAKAPGKAKVTIRAYKNGRLVAKKKVAVTVKRIRPDVDKQTLALHAGEVSKDWTPFYDYPKLKVSYSSADKAVAKVDKDGTLHPVAPGKVTITAVSAKTGKYESAKAVLSLIVLSGEDGLYLTNHMPHMNHFYYQGKKYMSGKLPPDVERELCRTQPDLKVYLDDYLAKYRARISDPTEAALTAIINYGAQYMRTVVVDPNGSRNMEKDHFVFDPAIVGTIEDAKDLWMDLISDRKGACVYYSSLFSYLCFLSDVPAMQLEDKGHDWNLIYHDGYYYNLDNHYLLCAQEDGFVAPPFTEGAATIFGTKIISKNYVRPKVSGDGPGQMPVTKISDFPAMGKDLSEKCPLLMYERATAGDAETADKTEAAAGENVADGANSANGPDATDATDGALPEYRVFFSTLEKGNVPTLVRGASSAEITLGQLIYRNMELDAGNDEAAPSFEKASKLLQKEVEGLFQ